MTMVLTSVPKSDIHVVIQFLILENVPRQEIHCCLCAAYENPNIVTKSTVCCWVKSFKEGWMCTDDKARSNMYVRFGDWRRYYRHGFLFTQHGTMNSSSPNLVYILTIPSQKIWAEARHRSITTTCIRSSNAKLLLNTPRIKIYGVTLTTLKLILTNPNFSTLQNVITFWNTKLIFYPWILNTYALNSMNSTTYNIDFSN